MKVSCLLLLLASVRSIGGMRERDVFVATVIDMLLLARATCRRVACARFELRVVWTC